VRTVTSRSFSPIGTALRLIPVALYVPLMNGVVLTYKTFYNSHNWVEIITGKQFKLLLIK
jgi:hypothetical protein